MKKFRMMTLHVNSGSIVKPSFAVPRWNRKILTHFMYVLLIVCDVSHHRSMKNIGSAELCACVRTCVHVCVFLNPHTYSISSDNIKYIITPQNRHQISLSIKSANKAKCASESSSLGCSPFVQSWRWRMGTFNVICFSWLLVVWNGSSP